MAKKKKSFSSKGMVARKKATPVNKTRVAIAAPPKRAAKTPKKTPAKSRIAIEPADKSVPGVLWLTKRAALTLRANWRLFLGMTVIYLVLNILLVHGFGSGIDIAALKESIQNNKQAHSSTVATATTLFGYLLTSDGTVTESGGVYQSFLVILISLAIIWALREVMAGAKVRIRDTFYKSTYPIIPFTLVLLVVALQLIPLLIAAWIVTTIIGGGIAVTFNERAIVLVVSGLLALTSLYMLCSSIFALYIATLPDMTPLRALRAARKLVKKRRWLIMRRLLYLPLLLVVVGAVIILPFLLVVPTLALWAYFVVTMFVPLATHSYIYTLYREML